MTDTNEAKTQEAEELAREQEKPEPEEQEEPAAGEQEEPAKEQEELGANEQESSQGDAEAEKSEQKAKRGKHAANPLVEAHTELPSISADEDATQALAVQDAELASQDDDVAYVPAFNPETGESVVMGEAARRSYTKPVLITLAIIVVVLAALYVAGAMYFTDRFFPNTTIGSLDVSMKTVDETSRVLSKHADDYELKVTGDDFKLTLKAKDFKFTYQEGADVEQLYADQNKWAWPYEVFGKHDVTDKLVASYDNSKLESAVRKAVKKHNRKATNTKNASIKYDDKEHTFVAVDEEYGTKLETEVAVDKIIEAVATIQDTLELGQDELVQPTIVASDPKVAKAIKKANKMVKADLTLTMGDDEVAEVNSDQISQWIKLGKNIKVSFDTAAMDEWVDKLASSCDTVGTRRKYTRTVEKKKDGKTKKVKKEITVEGGDYGWSVDHDKLITKVQEGVKAGKKATIAIPTKTKGAQYKGVGKKDWKKRYIDVDLKEQHVYFFDEDGKVIWQSDCVSGLATADRETPQGVYDINLKESPSTLVGYEDGEKSYESEVSYWMPFKGNSVGLHDATWRSEFGGSIYKSNGSHGCVNLPLDKAKKLYSLIKVGDVVVVHY